MKAHLRKGRTTINPSANRRATAVALNKETMYENLKKRYNKCHDIKLSVLRRVKTYRCIDNICKLIQEEKLAIVTYPDKNNLYNQQSVVMPKCKVFFGFFFRFLHLIPCPSPSDIFDLQCFVNLFKRTWTLLHINHPQ